MPALQLFVNTACNALVAGLQSTSPVDPASLPLFYGDRLALSITLLGLPPGYNPTDVSNSRLAGVVTAGLRCFIFIDDGTIAGLASPYAGVELASKDGTTWTGTLPLSTTALQTLLGSNAQSPAWLHIGLVDGSGNQQTVLSRACKIGVGIGAAASGLRAPPLGGGSGTLTPLYAEEAAGLFMSINPVAGRALYLMSPAGKTLALSAFDLPDGTISTGFSQLN